MKDDSVKKLVNLGLKVTPQRQAILRILDGNVTHPGAESIYEQLLQELPRISFATVYNTLSKLVEAKAIQEIDIDPTRKRYDPNTAPHHHFYCKSCGNVFDLVDDPLLSVDMTSRNTKPVNGHEIDTVEVNFKGTCRACKKRGPCNLV